MTEEQEVIKYIEKRIKVCNENADICDDNDFDEEATYLREESYMLETVLSMLKEKDRQIDLMAEEINETDRGYIDYCQFKIVCDRNCKDCIKQYFAGLVERKSEEC